MAKKQTSHSAPTDGTTRLHALLIASDFYFPNRLAEGSYMNLGGCVRDVEHVETFLRRRLGLTDERLVKLTSTDGGGAEPREPPAHRPTYENLVNAFKKITAVAATGDQVYIHYSGHGGRTPTLVPKVKGPRALDEAIVPIDIGSSSARYLRDVEIAKLLKAMVDKGLVVTVVFDCCHSGGAARDALRPETNMAIRGVSFVDLTPRPMESLVGTPEELAATWPVPPGDARGAVARDLVGQAEALGYTLLAACRPSESAYEFAFEGSERNGALTYWLLNALQQLGPELTYRMVYDRVLARIHSQFECQTPLLQGDADRVVFGTVALQPEFATPVMSVAADGKSVVLGAGQANLLRAGAQLAVYPNGTLDFTQTDRRTALLRVRQIGAAEAVADIVQVFGKAKVQPGDEAVLLGAPSQKLVRRVRLREVGAQDGPLQAVAKALPGNGWVEAVVNPSDTADFVVRLSDDGTHYLICDADGQPLLLRPDVASGGPGAAATVVKRLVHLAKYRAVQDLENNDASSPLKGKLVARLLGVQNDFDPADRPDPTPFRAGEPPTLRPGQWTFLRIENRSDRVLNVTVLDLQPNGGIAYAHPRGGDLNFTPLDPGGEPLVIPLQAGLPPGYTTGTDTLKILATVEPTSFRALELPALDEPPAPKARRGVAGSPLDTLLDAMTADRPPSRDMTAAAVPSQGWTTVQLEVRLTAAPGEPTQGEKGAVAGEAVPAPAPVAAVLPPPPPPGMAPQPATGGGAAPPPPPQGPPSEAVPFQTVRQRSLSLWQSAVEEVVARRTAGVRAAARGSAPAPLPLTHAAVQNADPVLAATALAVAINAGQPLDNPELLPAPAAAPGEMPRGILGTAWKCNKLALQLAWAKASGDAHTAQKLGDELAFGTCDPLWAETVALYLSYFVKNKGNIPYRSGGDYVLNVSLPDNATVALLADWGTGTQAANDVLAQVARKKPDVVFHLGDIYYSGTRNEVQARFLDVCRASLGSTPVFSLAGNHDMYSGGEGYYWLVDQLKQQASYFCVRNGHWQFLAMDTGYSDFNPFTVNSAVPSLTDEELRWHKAKIQAGAESNLKTVLLSHHQLFSAFEPIGKQPVNNLLLDQFRDVLGQVTAWFWGHEHRLDVYAPYLGLERGRCVGCAAIPEFVREDYFTPKFSVPLLADPQNGGRPVTLGDTGTVYNHAYAIMKLNGKGAQIAYYQDADENKPLFEEVIPE